MTLDFRDPDAANLAALGDRIRASAAEAAGAHGVRSVWIPDEQINPTRLDGRMRELIRRQADGLELSAVSMPSGAGHDAQNLATIAPAGMIFVPSIAGRSHCPDEHTDWDDVTNGANVLLNTLVELATAGLR
jgi:N-carbamoyl-L-amino-acid hydrolase